MDAYTKSFINEGQYKQNEKPIHSNKKNSLMFVRIHIQYFIELIQ